MVKNRVGSTARRAGSFGLLILASAVGSSAFAEPQQSGSYALIAYLRVQPGTERQFLDATPEVIAKSRKEPGNLIYNLHQSSQNPQEFVFYELFRSHDDLGLHRNAKYVTDFLARVNPFLIPNGFALNEYQVLSATKTVQVPENVRQDLTLTSKAIPDGSRIRMDQVFNGFGCTGGNVSPDLSWTGAPDGTKSFAVTIYDQDAPTGSGWWHWTVFNIPADTSHLNAGVGTSNDNPLPQGAIQGRTDFGKSAYGGPCPSVGDLPHHYTIKVYALKDSIPLDQDASGAMLGFYISQLKLAEGAIAARFGR